MGSVLHTKNDTRGNELSQLVYEQIDVTSLGRSQEKPRGRGGETGANATVEGKTFSVRLMPEIERTP